MCSVGVRMRINNKTKQFNPIKVNLSNDVIIKSINCGQSHSLLLSTVGDVYTFGSNSNKQLGNNKKNRAIDSIKTE